MQLVEQHIIGKSDSRYEVIDAATFASKNLYNLANYHMRQSFIHQGKYLGYAEVFHLVKQTDAYRALPRKVSNDVLQLPHARFVNMLCYKAKLVGIQVILQEESYTSKASFLDSDPLPTYGQCEQEPHFSGRRVKRGLYRASDKRYINADINGAYNILRKASPNAFGNGVEAVAVQPRRLTVSTGGHLS